MPKKPPRPPTPLTGKQRSHLRALAHPLKAVVQIGRQGLTPGVLNALRAAFDKHELVKVKVAGDAEVDAEELAPQVEKATNSQVAQIIGHTLVVYRRHDKLPKIVLPQPSKKKRAIATPAPAAQVRDEPDEGDSDQDESDEDESDEDESDEDESDEDEPDEDEDEDEPHEDE